MRRLRFLFPLLFVCVLASSSEAEIHDDAGTKAYQFLKIGVGGRPMGMGGAFIGLADDVNALFWNPAGLCQLEEAWAMATYRRYWADINSGFLGYIRPWGTVATVGFSVNYMNYGEMDEMDDLGNRLGTFGASDMAVAIAYARALPWGLLIGTNLKFIYESIQDYSSDGLALDLGALYPMPNGRTKVGAVIQNMGVQLKGMTNEHEDELPTVIKLGLSHHLVGLPLVIAVDLVKPLDNDFYLTMGGETTGPGPLHLRTGWDLRHSRENGDFSQDDLAGLSTGFGLKWQGYLLDYAYTFSFAELGDIHRLSLAKAF